MDSAFGTSKETLELVTTRLEFLENDEAPRTIARFFSEAVSMYKSHIETKSKSCAQYEEAMTHPKNAGKKHQESGNTVSVKRINHVLALVSLEEFQKIFVRDFVPQFVSMLEHHHSQNVRSFRKVFEHYEKGDRTLCLDIERRWDVVQKVLEETHSSVTIWLETDMDHEPMDDPDIPRDENSTIYAVYIHSQLANKLKELESSRHQKSKQVQGIKGLVDAYSANSQLGDHNMTTKAWMEKSLELSLVEMEIAHLESQVRLLGKFMRDDPKPQVMEAVAMYKYAAIQEDELSIAVGEKLQISGQEEDGWIRAYKNTGEGGLVPRNYLKMDSARETVQALYPYTAQAEDELSFQRGDTIEIVEEDRDGWSKGVCNGKAGYFPTNFTLSGEIPGKF